MPETTNMLANPFFSLSAGTSLTNAADDDLFDSMELLGLGLPELKLTRQNGRYFDVEEGRDERGIVV